MKSGNAFKLSQKQQSCNLCKLVATCFVEDNAFPSNHSPLQLIRTDPE